MNVYSDITQLDECKILNLPKILDNRGNLTVVEELKQIPFEIARVYWIYDVPGGEKRGSHAFREQSEILIALSGSFDVVTHDGKKEQHFLLNRSYYGLYMPPMTWRTIENFSTNAVCLIISSHKFSEKDYIRNFEEFINERKNFKIKASAARDESRLSLIKNNPTVYDASIIEIQKIVSGKGHISVAEGGVNLPYDIKRVYYLYDIPASSERGAHAHRKCHRFLVAASGAYEVTLDDGLNRRTIRLDRPFYGLHIPPGLWTSIQSFSSGSICLSLASHGYDEKDYIREYEIFKNGKVQLDIQ